MNVIQLAEIRLNLDSCYSVFLCDSEYNNGVFILNGLHYAVQE